MRDESESEFDESGESGECDEEIARSIRRRICEEESEDEEAEDEAEEEEEETDQINRKAEAIKF